MRTLLDRIPKPAQFLGLWLLAVAIWLLLGPPLGLPPDRSTGMIAAAAAIAAVYGGRRRTR